IWFSSSKNQLITTTSGQLKSTASDFAHQIESYVELKAIGLIIHSQTESLLSFNVPQSTRELQNLLLQDKDVDELSVIDAHGKETIHVDRNRVYQAGELLDQSSSLAFKIPTFVGGDRYISSMYIDQKGQPSIYIAIPIVKPESQQELQQLTTSSSGKSRKVGEILGVLKANINLSNFWEQIVAAKIGSHGYVFVVDDKGNTIAHRDKSLSKRLANLRSVDAINKFVISLTSEQKAPEQTVFQEVNEYGIPSLISYQKVNLTNWGVIAQVPLSDVLKDTNQISWFILLIVTSLLTVIFLGSLWLSRIIVKPIYELQKGSDLIGAGDLNYQISLRTGDEIEELGAAFNSMTKNLKTAFDNVERDKDIISAERNKVSIAISNIADAVILVDLEKNVIVFNKAAESITGYTAQEVLGRKIYNVIQVLDDKSPISHDVYCPVKTGDVEALPYIRDEVEIHARLNAPVFVSIKANPTVYGTTVNAGCIITLHDLSQEKQLEKMKLDFVSMAAHELRTPITAIRGYLSVYLTENEKDMNADQKMLTHHVYLAAERLAALVESLLSVSRIDRSTFSISIMPSNWMETVQEVVNELALRAREKNISLSLLAPQDPIPTLSIDKLRMSEVLSNLILNAINYTPENGAITVSIDKRGGEVVTHIKDTGRGIASDAIPHLFTKFFRVSGKLEGVKGTGLGLYLSKAIVEKHGGKIWVESEMGHGSTFSFSLPLTHVEPHSSAESSHVEV
ncbi:HAMP domain-containing protein, partial [Candidatus Microgenomates bacterium]|nr:HAMP domain-containing protein [Candidatus Microgenomates bacterium]